MQIKQKYQNRQKGNQFRLLKVFYCVLIAVGQLFYLSVKANTLKAGISFYSRGHYARSVDMLSKAVKDDPYNQKAHYYLANALIYMQDKNAAIREYSICFDLDPLTECGQHARKALLTLRQGISSIVFSSRYNNSVRSDDANSIKNAVAQINRQTNDQERILREQGLRATHRISQNGLNREWRINQSASELIEDLEKNNRRNPWLIADEIREIRQRALFSAQRARYDSQQQALKHMSLASQHAYNIENSASNLLALIAEDARPGRIKVMAAGTNLYVRNYAFEPAKPLEAMHAEINPYIIKSVKNLKNESKK